MDPFTREPVRVVTRLTGLRLAALALAAIAWLAPARAGAADSVLTLEYKVKAGYLFQFAKFVEWPASAFPSADSPFVIGVLDRNEAVPIV